MDLAQAKFKKKVYEENEDKTNTISDNNEKEIKSSLKNSVEFIITKLETNGKKIFC